MLSSCLRFLHGQRSSRALIEHRSEQTCNNWLAISWEAAWCVNWSGKRDCWCIGVITPFIALPRLLPSASYLLFGWSTDPTTPKGTFFRKKTFLTSSIVRKKNCDRKEVSEEAPQFMASSVPLSRLVNFLTQVSHHREILRTADLNNALHKKSLVGNIKIIFRQSMLFISKIVRRRNIVTHIWRHDALNDLYGKAIYYTTQARTHRRNINRHTQQSRCMFKKRNKIITSAQP